MTLKFLIMTKERHSVCMISIETRVDAVDSMVSRVAPLLTEMCSMITEICV